MRRLLALTLLCACPSTSLHSTVVEGLAVYTQGRLNGEQTCQPAPELLACAERQALYLLAEAVERGHAPSVDAARRQWGHPLLCLVERQEPCCAGGGCAPSSTPELSKAPRAACTYWNATWLARLDSRGQPYDYSTTLYTELKTSIAGKLSIGTSPQHAMPWDLVPYPGGELTCEWRKP